MAGSGGAERWLAALIALLCSAARAEEPEQGLPSVGLENIEIRARHEPIELLQDEPVATQIIPLERIRALPVRDLAGIAKQITGVRIQQRVQGQKAAASVEGMPPEYTRVLVDGQHYSGELGGVADLADLPTVNAERIVVIRGPQAMRYGSDSGGAVLEVQTREPPGESGARLFAEGGAGDAAQHYAAQAAAVRSGAFGMSLATAYRGIDGQQERGTDAVVVGTGDDSRERSQDLYTTLHYEAGELLSFHSKLGWRKEEDEFAAESGSDQRISTRWLQSVGFNRSLARGGELRAELYHFDADTRSGIGRAFELLEDEWKLDASLRSELDLWGAVPELTLGFDWRAPSLEERESESLAGAIGSGEVDERFTSAGIFAILRAPLAERVELELGLRQQLHSEFESRLLPQAALRFDPLDSLRLRLGYGQSYRTPSLRDLYQPPVPNLGGAYFLAGNPDLETESAFGVRLGLEWTPLDWLSFSATGYENQIDDFIRSGLAGSIQVGTRYDPPQLPPESLICRTRPDDPRCLPSVVPLLRSLYRKSNLDQVRTRGIDLQVNSRPLNGVSLKLGYGFLRTEVDSKTLIDLEELPNEPRHTFDAEATWTLPRVETAFTVRARWRDEALIETSGTGLSSFTSLEHSDPSWVVDLRLVQPLFRGISLYLDVENLTNEKVIDSYEIRARTLFFGLRYELEPSRR